MIRIAVIFLVSLLTASCVTTPHGQGDHWLQWGENAATLYLYSSDGKLVSPYGTELISLPGYLFSDGKVRFHPGKRRIGLYCEPTGDYVLHDSIPSKEFDFKAGEAYDLRCVDGLPVITKHKANS